MEFLFKILSFSPGPFWILILILPANRRAMLAVDLFLIALSALFAVQTIPIVATLLPMLANPEFATIHAFLSSEQGFVGSWNHMILADLWIGRWVAQDSLHSRRSLLIRLLFIPPILFFGPLGLFLYFVFRVITRRTIALTNVPQRVS